MGSEKEQFLNWLDYKQVSKNSSTGIFKNSEVV
jgi:hypothetical protein